MSIDDKMERLHRERRLTERTNAENPSNKNSSYEGYTIAPEDYFQANATQSDPMDFCPECNGMMLPYLDGHKCNDCGYTKGVSEELIKETKKEEKRYTYSSVETKPKVNNYRPRSRIIKPKQEDISTSSSDELNHKLTNLEEDLFNIVILLLGVPKSLEKEEQISFIMDNYRLVRIENAINYAEEIKP